MSVERVWEFYPWNKPVGFFTLDNVRSLVHCSCELPLNK